MSNNIHFSCICGIDIAKKVMQVFKVTSDGVVTNTSVSRKDFLEHFRNIPPALIGMEACATSQHWDASYRAWVTLSNFFRRKL
jgi:transposase